MTYLEDQARQTQRSVWAQNVPVNRKDLTSVLATRSRPLSNIDSLRLADGASTFTAWGCIS